MILGVLQARMSSTRLPGKVMADVAGEPMLGRQVERLRRSRRLDRLVLATSDGKGGADASPRGDMPGFVRVLDDRTLLIPDRRGNNRADSFGNVISSSGVGIVFMVPGISETLRVNGMARVTRDAELLAPSTVQQRPPLTGFIVAVDEAYFHCGKALIRSKLWDPASQVPRQSFPTLGRIVAEQTKLVEADAADRNLEEAYRDRLY